MSLETQSVSCPSSWSEFKTFLQMTLGILLWTLQDPMPTWLIKKFFASLLCIIVTIVNMSLVEGIVPSSMKAAVIKPLLKKENLDCNTLKNYHPVSNLSFLPKVLERVVAKQPKQYTSDHNLHKSFFQSAYKQYHSTESALLMVHNNILLWQCRIKASLYLFISCI